MEPTIDESCSNGGLSTISYDSGHLIISLDSGVTSVKESGSRPCIDVVFLDFVFFTDVVQLAERTISFAIEQSAMTETSDV